MFANNMQAAVDEAGKVVKKQKVCAQKVEDCLDQLVSLVSTSRQQLAAEDQGNSSQILQDLHKRIDELSLVKSITNSTKDFHKAISSLDKALEKSFDNIDICKALRDVQFDRATLDRILAEHLYREGRFDVADQLVAEAGLSDADSIKQPFAEMHMILREIQARNLGPALQWAEEHRSQLTQDAAPSDFEFRLHSLAFLNILNTQGCLPALRYAQSRLTPFQRTHLKDIQRLMGALVFSKRSATNTAAASTASTSGTSGAVNGSSSRRRGTGGEGGRASESGAVNGGGTAAAAGGAGEGLGSSCGPYASLMGGQRWEEVEHEFARLACSVMGQAQESPLLVSVSAGSRALPQLLKMVALDSKVVDVVQCEQLPVEVELGPEFVFRSIFACPVSRDQSSPTNPPMLLPCNHVLCQESILKIAKNRMRVFKCPYCPMDARPDNLRKLTFPDLQ